MSRENYPIYVHWFKTLNWILDCVERLPHKVRFSVASRISDLALDVLELIVEAIYSKNRGQLLGRINLNLEKLRVLFRLCFERRHISMKQYEWISRALDETGQMAGGWAKST